MRIALFSDIYKPHINGVVNHVRLLKEHFDRWGEQVYLFVPEQDKAHDEESNVIRLPSIPIADTGYNLSVRLDARCRDILKRMDVIHVHHPFYQRQLRSYFFAALRHPFGFYQPLPLRPLRPAVSSACAGDAFRNGAAGLLPDVQPTLQRSDRP